MSSIYHRNQPISNHFYSLGTDGIGLHRIEERRASERALAAAGSTGKRTRAFPALRRTIGSWLISAGELALSEPAAASAS